MPKGIYQHKPHSEDHKRKIAEKSIFQKGHRLNLGRRKIKKPNTICKICQKEFFRIPSRKAIFCSPKCQAVALKGIKRPEMSEITRLRMASLSNEERKILGDKISRAKKGVSNHKQGGENCHFWKGNKMAEYPEKERIRKSLEYGLWRKANLIRDNFTCQKYGIRGGRLVVHHINNFNDFPELRLALDNGITFSKEAHIDFHKIYGKINNTREQLEEFIK